MIHSFQGAMRRSVGAPGLLALFMGAEAELPAVPICPDVSGMKAERSIPFPLTIASLCCKWQVLFAPHGNS